MNKQPIPNVKVIHSCDDNPYYLDFWYPMSKLWKTVFNITPVLFHVGNKTDISDEYGEVHTVAPDESLPIHTQAQLGRLWYPINEPDVLWITNDIDMFPLSKSYWSGIIEEWNEHRPDWSNLNASKSSEYHEYGDNYFPICYNVALGKMFKTVLGIEDSYFDFVKRIVTGASTPEYEHVPENWNGEPMKIWNADEVLIIKRLYEFMNEGGHVWTPEFPNHRRVNRTYWVYNEEAVRHGLYVDAHSVRPYNQHIETIDRLLKLVGEQR